MQSMSSLVVLPVFLDTPEFSQSSSIFVARPSVLLLIELMQSSGTVPLGFLLTAPAQTAGDAAVQGT